MKNPPRSAFWNAFVGYTSLGYLSLALHHWVFFPHRNDQVTDLGMTLMLINLAAGGFCFWKGFRESFSWWRSTRDDAS